MLTVRRANDRGLTDFGWLHSRHSFSFGDYYDPAHMGYRSLRVINDDRVAPGGGFPMHPHRDMEILTCVVAGRLEHRDSMGNGTVIRPGEWQKMSAGTGVRHSEFNPSADEPVHLLQIWLLPDRRGLTPEYDQKPFPAADRRGRFRVVASNDGRDGSIRLHQDAVLASAAVGPGERAGYPLAAGRGAWVHVVTGTATVNGTKLFAGDAAAVEGEPRVEVVGETEAEVLVFDLA